MRKRLFSDLKPENHSNNSWRGRVACELTQQQAASPAVPLSQILKRDWAAGKLSSEQVLVRAGFSWRTVSLAQYFWILLENNFPAAQSRVSIHESGTAEEADSCCGSSLTTLFFLEDLSYRFLTFPVAVKV